MTASIATTEQPFTVSSSCLSSEIEDNCRELLTDDLLEINDKFLNFINWPLRRSYEIDGEENALFAGEYPGDRKDYCAK